MEPFWSTLVTPFLKSFLKFHQIAFGGRFENHHGLQPFQGIASFGYSDSNENYNNNKVWSFIIYSICDNSLKTLIIFSLTACGY